MAKGMKGGMGLKTPVERPIKSGGGGKPMIASKRKLKGRR